jgi:hypothetical protein
MSSTNGSSLPNAYSWVLYYDRRLVGHSLLEQNTPFEGSWRDFCYCQLRVCWYGAVSLTGERVCRLQLLLALASVIILGSGSRGTRDHILLPQMWDFPFRRLLRLTGLRWRYSTPPPHGSYPPSTPLHEPSKKHRFQQYLYWCYSGNEFSKPLLRNDSTL